MNLNEYLEELKKIDVLQPQSEKNLWRSYKQENDMEARRTLIEAYQPLVFKQAMQFRILDNIMDIIQEGTVGLIEAAENYDHERGAAFSLYAVHRIRGRMLNFVRKEGSCDIACLDGTLAEAGGLTAAHAIVDPTAAVAERAEKNFLVAELQSALQRLPEKEREVLRSVYLQNQEPRDVAAALAVSTSHIYRLQKTGIRRVRGMLSKLMQHWQ